jgi:hypothetical protein
MEANTSQEPRIPPRNWSAEITGAALLVAGVLLLLSFSDVVAIGVPVVLAVTLLTIGVGMIVLPVRRYGGLVVLGIFLTFALIVTSVGFTSPHRTSFDVGERVFRPAEIEEIGSGEGLSGGELSIDLTDIDFPEGDTSLEFGMRFGEMRIRVPDDVALRLEISLGAGDVHVDGPSVASGVGIERTITDPGFQDAERRLTLELSMGVGTIKVDRGLL